MYADIYKYVYIYIHIYILIFLLQRCTHLHTYAAHTSIYIWHDLNVNTCRHTHTHIYSCTHIYICTQRCTRLHTDMIWYICQHIQTHTHIYIFTCLCIYIRIHVTDEQIFFFQKIEARKDRDEVVGRMDQMVCKT